MTIQVAPDDCTGCGVCVDVCPAVSKEVARHKAINMETKSEDHLGARGRTSSSSPRSRTSTGTQVKADTVKGSQLLEPLFEFSGACAGCGETPYLKLLTQLYGDRLIVANATGCSSIYGGNLPTTPWAKNQEGRGPAWSNSLFEDNAEFGLGMRLAVNQQEELRATCLESWPRKWVRTWSLRSCCASGDRGGDPRTTPARGSAQGTAIHPRGPRGEGPPHGGRHARAAERLDRRWRRLGV